MMAHDVQGAQQHAAGTEAALEGVVREKCLLQLRQFAAVRQPLDGVDAPAIGLHRQHQKPSRHGNAVHDQEQGQRVREVGRTQKERGREPDQDPSQHDGCRTREEHHSSVSNDATLFTGLGDGSQDRVGREPRAIDAGVFGLNAPGRVAVGRLVQHAAHAAREAPRVRIGEP